MTQSGHSVAVQNVSSKRDTSRDDGYQGSKWSLRGAGNTEVTFTGVSVPVLIRIRRFTPDAALHVRNWPEADMPIAATNIRFGGKALNDARIVTNSAASSRCSALLPVACCSQVADQLVAIRTQCSGNI